MKRVIFIQIGTGFFAVEIDQVERFVNNVKISDFGVKGKIPETNGFLPKHYFCGYDVRQ